MAKIWYDMSVSRRQNDITALKNIKISSGKSRKKPQFVTNPGKSTDSLTIETLFHVEIRIVIFWITYIYIQFSWIGQLVENIAIMSGRWNTSVFLRDKRNITKTNKTVLVSALLNKRTAQFWRKSSKSILSERWSTNSANWNGCINKHAYFSVERVIWQLFPLKSMVFCDNLKLPSEHWPIMIIYQVESDVAIFRWSG